MCLMHFVLCESVRDNRRKPIISACRSFQVLLCFLNINSICLTMTYFLFTFPVPSFSKIACFETSSKLLPVVLGDFRNLVKHNKFQQAISACAELAFDKSYKFFVLGYHGICRSGPHARQQYHSKSSLSDKNCPNGIGIDKSIEVYTFGKSSL